MGHAMAYRDFQHFLDVLHAQGELVRVAEPLSPYLEITEVADRVMKAGGPALLFDNPAGTAQRHGTPDPRSAVMGQPSIDPAVRPSATRSYPFPVAINTMGTRKRMSLALSCDDIEDHANRIGKLLKARPPQGTIMDKVKFGAWLAGEIKNVHPKTVGEGISQ